MLGNCHCFHFHWIWLDVSAVNDMECLENLHFSLRVRLASSSCLDIKPLVIQNMVFSMDRNVISMADYSYLSWNWPQLPRILIFLPERCILFLLGSLCILFVGLDIWVFLGLQSYLSWRLNHLPVWGHIWRSSILKVFWALFAVFWYIVFFW